MALIILTERVSFNLSFTLSSFKSFSFFLCSLHFSIAFDLTEREMFQLFSSAVQLSPWTLSLPPARRSSSVLHQQPHPSPFLSCLALRHLLSGFLARRRSSAGRWARRHRRAGESPRRKKKGESQSPGSRFSWLDVLLLTQLLELSCVLYF